MELVLVLVVLGGLTAVAVAAGKTGKKRELARAEAEVAPVKRLAEEDVTALGVELQDLDIDLAGEQLDPGANADYQRALDAYESAKTAAAALTRPDDVRHVTEILEDGRYAMACVRARVAGQPLPQRRPPVLLRPAPRHVGRRRAVDPAGRRVRATSPPARSTSSGSAPAPSPTSAR